MRKKRGELTVETRGASAVEALRLFRSVSVERRVRVALKISKGYEDLLLQTAPSSDRKRRFLSYAGSVKYKRASRLKSINLGMSNLRESFWGDLNGRTRRAWKKFFEADSERQRDQFAVVEAYERNNEQRRGYRNGYYERGFVTVFGSLQLRIARTREQSFLSAVSLPKTSSGL